MRWASHHQLWAHTETWLLRLLELFLWKNLMADFVVCFCCGIYVTNQYGCKRLHKYTVMFTISGVPMNLNPYTAITDDERKLILQGSGWLKLFKHTTKNKAICINDLGFQSVGIGQASIRNMWCERAISSYAKQAWRGLKPTLCWSKSISGSWMAVINGWINVCLDCIGGFFLFPNL